VANLYGVANPNPLPNGFGTPGGTDVAVPAGVETNFVAGVAPLPNIPGIFYPTMIGFFTITFGATPPTLVTIASRINNGADIQAWNIHGGFYVANGSLLCPCTFYDNNQVFSNPSGTMTFQVSCLSAAQPLTVRASSTLINMQWVRAPDQ
jgi:hypothetical protein